MASPIILLNANKTTTLHPFIGLFSRTTWVSRYQKGKTGLDLDEVRYDGVSCPPPPKKKKFEIPKRLQIYVL